MGRRLVAAFTGSHGWPSRLGADPAVEWRKAPEAGSLVCERAAPKDSVGYWPMAINILTHLGARPRTGSRLLM
jgi:hypothetical protein